MKIFAGMIALLFAAAATASTEAYSVTIKREDRNVTLEIQLTADGLDQPFQMTTPHEYMSACVESAGRQEKTMATYETGPSGTVSLTRLDDESLTLQINVRHQEATDIGNISTACGDIQVPSVEVSEARQTLGIPRDGGEFDAGEFRVSVKRLSPPVRSSP